MGHEQFLSLGLDADHAAMSMDRRPPIEQLKELIQKLREKREGWKSSPIIGDEIPKLDLDTP